MKNKTTEYELVVTQGERPLWMRLLAVVLFSLMLYKLVLLVMHCYEFGVANDDPKFIPDNIKLMTYCLVGGIYFCMTKTVLIDLDKDLLISRFHVGIFSKDVKSKVPELEYVSVFNSDDSEYQVNLWYVKNKHYKMYVFTEKEPALQFGARVAQKLDIDLLDATERGNSKWIDKTAV